MSAFEDAAISAGFANEKNCQFSARLSCTRSRADVVSKF